MPLLQGNAMTRDSVATDAPSDAWFDDRTLAQAQQSQVQWLDQIVDLQTKWLTSCLAMQAASWRQCASAPFGLLPWMVWHNGTEQLA